MPLIREISEKRLAHVKFDYVPYEPKLKQYSEPPSPAPLVVCLNYLQHVTPDKLDETLDDLKRVVTKIGFLVISANASEKYPEDWDSTQLIVERAEWWLPRLTDRFTLQSFQRWPEGFVALVSPVEP
jgi:hypothetical protein